MNSGEDLSPEDVFRVALAIEGIDAFVIGGQALNIWAERYSARAPELQSYGPFTSKDVDYFGFRAAAEALAAKLGGEVEVPLSDDLTPNTAIVRAMVNGKLLEIDFLSNVLGVEYRRLRRDQVEIRVPCPFGGAKADVSIRLMHPVHCLQSRASNVFQLRRRDNTSRRQLAAAVPVAREYILECLETGAPREAIDSVRQLFYWLRTNPFAMDMPAEEGIDPLNALADVADASGWDARYRAKILLPMIDRIRSRRV